MLALRSARRAVVPWLVLLAAAAVPPRILQAQVATPPAALRLVVIAGDGAVNGLRQKRFVTPIVEVRDDRDQPVAGVPVRFVVRDGRGAILSGQTALTVTTGPDGRSTIPGFAPTTAGPLTIDATASFRGVTASVAIAQTTIASLAGAAPSATARPAATAAVPGGLRIVVIAGEDAINVIQQKTAVAPIVEVRDRNDQPVAGVAVRFAVRGRGASFGGQQAVSLTTNAAGRAAVTNFTPTASGALQIDVTVAFQGQVANATISQTTFATAAEAASAGASTASSGTSTSAGSGSAGTAGGVGSAAAGVGVASGGAAGAGAGLSATTIGLIGAGAAVATVGVAAAASGGDDQDDGGTIQNLTLTAPVSLPFRYDVSFSFGDTCRYTYTTMATARLTLQVQPRGAASGQLEFVDGSTSVTTVCSTLGSIDLGSSNGYAGWDILTAPVTGTASSLSARAPGSSSFTDSSGSAITHTWETAFTGTLANGVVTGTLSRTLGCTWPGQIISCSGTGSAPVTLR